MIGSPVAKRYATALLELAAEQNVAPKVGTDLTALGAAWEASPELRAMFANPQFGVEQKQSVAKALGERVRAHGMVVNTLQMLAERGRLMHLPDIAEVYSRIAETRSGQVRAEVVSAKKLPESYYAKLQKKLEASTGKKVVLVKREDPSLIGGVVTTINGRVYDGSIKNRLRELRSELLSSSDPSKAAN